MKVDPYELNRFVSAQAPVYAAALAELKHGKKRTHWMWYIFPQIDGLGFSATTKFYSIKSIEEARQYLAHPLLGPRLIACAEAVYALKGKSVAEIFEAPDDQKFWSSMTLFAVVAEGDSIFARVLDKYFGGKKDENTLHLMRAQSDA